MSDEEEAKRMAESQLVEAALEAFALASGLGILPDEEDDEDWRDDLWNGMRAAIAAIRPAVLEEAAKEFDQYGDDPVVASVAAAAIRALKDVR